MCKPVVQLVLGLQNGTDDIDDTEVRTVWNLNVSSVLVLWKDEPALTLDQKVDRSYVISFEEDILVFREWSWPKKRTHIRDESRRPPSEAMNPLVGILMDEE